MESITQLPFIWQGTLAGILIGLMTLLGAIPLLMLKEIDQKKQDLLLGMSGGIMLAAGAMFYVIVYEIIPYIQKHGNRDMAVNSLIAGFILMMYLDVTLG